MERLAQATVPNGREEVVDWMVSITHPSTTAVQLSRSNDFLLSPSRFGAPGAPAQAQYWLPSLSSPSSHEAESPEVGVDQPPPQPTQNPPYTVLAKGAAFHGDAYADDALRAIWSHMHEFTDDGIDCHCGIEGAMAENFPGAVGAPPGLTGPWTAALPSRAAPQFSDREEASASSTAGCQIATARQGQGEGGDHYGSLGVLPSSSPRPLLAPPRRMPPLPPPPPPPLPPLGGGPRAWNAAGTTQASTHGAQLNSEEATPRLLPVEEANLHLSLEDFHKETGLPIVDLVAIGKLDFLRQIPRDETGALTSVGSMQHEGGNCAPCLFWFRGGCSKGIKCTHCHFKHKGQKNKRIRPSKSTRLRMREEQTSGEGSEAIRL